MYNVNLGDCPRESDARFNEDDSGYITFTFTPVPATDGRNYVKVDDCVLTDARWPASVEAAMRAGWKFEPVANVRFTNLILCEVKPIEPPKAAGA